MNDSNSDDFFWALIEKYKDLPNDEFCDSLVNVLSEMSDQDINLFEIELIEKLNKMHTWQTVSFMLVAEGSAIYGDTYQFSCLGIIKQGKHFYERFISNPENIVEDIVRLWEKNQNIWCISFFYISGNALMKKYNIEDFEPPFEHPRVYAHRLGYNRLIDYDPLEEGEMPTFREAIERFPKFYAAWNKKMDRN